MHNIKCGVPHVLHIRSLSSVNEYLSDLPMASISALLTSLVTLIAILQILITCRLEA